MVSQLRPVKGAANSVLINSKSPAGQEDFADVLVEASFTRIADEGPISEEIAVQK